MATLNLIIEGEIDEIVAQRLVREAGHEVGASYGKRGAPYIKNKIQDFNKSADSIYYLALVDFMDTRCECPSDVILTWLPYKNEKMFFRVVVREIESWIMADRQNLAAFLNVGIEKIPMNPEHENDPKQKLVNIARTSRSAKMRSALVPERNSTAQVGKLYTVELRRFISDCWDVNSARLNSPSLDKCLRRLEEI